MPQPIIVQFMAKKLRAQTMPAWRRQLPDATPEWGACRFEFDPELREYLLDERGIAAIDMDARLHVRDLSGLGVIDDLLAGVDPMYHLDDIVDGLVSAMDKGMGQGTIQLGPDVCTTIREVAETIVEVSGKDITIEFDTSRPEGDRGRRADYSKARRVLGWEPRVKLKDGMEQTYRWVEQRMNLR